MPIRTGLDERIKSVQNELKEYFEEAKHIYDDAIDAFTKLDAQVYSEAKRARAKAREVNWDLTNDLLLILALNQPLMQDLRIIATYLRAVDTVERDSTRSRHCPLPTVQLMKMQTSCHKRLLTLCLEMHQYLNALIDITVECLTKGQEVPADDVRKNWRQVKDSHAKAVARSFKFEIRYDGWKSSPSRSCQHRQSC